MDRGGDAEGGADRPYRCSAGVVGTDSCLMTEVPINLFVWKFKDHGVTSTGCRDRTDFWLGNWKRARLGRRGTQKVETLTVEGRGPRGRSVVLKRGEGMGERGIGPTRTSKLEDLWRVERGAGTGGRPRFTRKEQRTNEGRCWTGTGGRSRGRR